MWRRARTNASWSLTMSSVGGLSPWPILAQSWVSWHWGIMGNWRLKNSRLLWYIVHALSKGMYNYWPQLHNYERIQRIQLLRLFSSQIQCYSFVSLSFTWFLHNTREQAGLCSHETLENVTDVPTDLKCIVDIINNTVLQQSNYLTATTTTTLPWVWSLWNEDVSMVQTNTLTIWRGGDGSDPKYIDAAFTFTFCGLLVHGEARLFISYDIHMFQQITGWTVHQLL